MVDELISMLGSYDTPDLHIHILLWKFCLIHFFSAQKFSHNPASQHTINLSHAEIHYSSSTQLHWTKKCQIKISPMRAEGGNFPSDFQNLLILCWFLVRNCLVHFSMQLEQQICMQCLTDQRSVINSEVLNKEVPLYFFRELLKLHCNTDIVRGIIFKMLKAHCN